jgi:hypothetical protein
MWAETGPPGSEVGISCRHARNRLALSKSFDALLGKNAVTLRVNIFSF